MGYGGVLCLPMHTNIYNQIYKQTDVHKTDEVRRVITKKYSENLKYAMCLCYTLEEAVCIWYSLTRFYSNCAHSRKIALLSSEKIDEAPGLHTPGAVKLKI